MMMQHRGVYFAEESTNTSIFYKLGHFVARHAWPMFIAGCLINSCFAIGLVESTQKTEVEELWIKQNGDVKIRIDYRDANTNEGYGSTSEMVTTIARPNGASVLSAEILQDHLDALERGNGVVYTYKGQEYGMTDVCVASTPYTAPCLRLTVLDCFEEGGFDVGPPYNTLTYAVGTRPKFTGSTTDVIKETISAGCLYYDGGAVLPNVELRLAIGSPTPADWSPDRKEALGPSVASPDARLEDAKALEAVYLFIEANELVDRLWAAEKADISVDDAEKILKEIKLHWVDLVVGNTGISQSNAYSSETFGELMDEYSEGSAPLLITGYVIMFVYAAACMIPWRRRKDTRVTPVPRPLVGLGGVLCVALAVVGSLGLSSWFGIAFNVTSTQVLPFLLLGLGVDDMFVMAETFPSLDTVTDPRILTARTMAVVGPSITLTSFTNCAVFVMGGAFTPLPVVSDFAYMAAIAIALAYFTGLLVFPAVMCLDQKRLQDQRNAFCPCGTTASVAVATSSTPTTNDKDADTTEADTDMMDADDAHLLSSPPPIVVSMAGLLSSLFGVIIVAAVYVVVVVLAIVGATELENGLSLAEVTPEGTQGAEFNEVRFKHFGFYGIELGFRNPEFDRTSQMEMQEVFYRVMQTSKVLDGTNNWMEAMILWMTDDCEDTGIPGKACAKNLAPQGSHECYEAYDIAPITWTGYTFDQLSPVCKDVTGDDVKDLCLFLNEDKFEMCLETWFDGNDPIVEILSMNLKMDKERDVPTRTIIDTIQFPIKYLEMPIYAFGLLTNDDYVTLIEEVEAVTAASPLDVFGMGTPFTYWEQYLTLRDDLWMAVTYSLIACFTGSSVLLLLVPAARSTSSSSRQQKLQHGVKVAVWGGLVITAVVALHVFLVYGFLGLADIKLSAMPVISLIMTVGVGVEFTAHIVLAFINGTGDRAMRVQEALAHMLVPTVNGSVSTLLGVIMLAFSDFEFIFKYFFLLYLFVILFGVLNGLLLLPTLLAYAGPPSIHAEDVTRTARLLQEEEGESDNKREGRGATVYPL